MGLLEKAEQKKHNLEKTKDIEKEQPTDRRLAKTQQIKKELEIKDKKEKLPQIDLLEKTKQKKQGVLAIKKSPEEKQEETREFYENSKSFEKEQSTKGLLVKAQQMKKEFEIKDKKEAGEKSQSPEETKEKELIEEIEQEKKEESREIQENKKDFEKEHIEVDLLTNTQQIKKELEIKDKKEKTTSVDLLRKTKEKQKEIVEKSQSPEEIKEKELIEEIEQEEQEKQETAEKLIQKETRNIEIIDEKTGFGWKELGTRQIVYDKDINEYLYEVSEPVLNKMELKIKNELVRLFKMLADVNVYDLDKEEKKKYLEETLEQIIIDNDVKFYIEEEEKPTEHSKMNLSFLRKGDKKKKSEKNNEKIEIKKKTFLSKKTEKKSSGKSQPTKKKTIKQLFKKKKEGASDSITQKKPSNNTSSLKSLKTKNETVDRIINKIELSEEEQKVKDDIFYHIFREFIGYGKMDILMADEGIEDISCDGDHVPLFIYHKKYEEVTTNIYFDDSDELDSFVVRLSQICGKQISIFSPIVDGKLPDGSRLQTTLSKTVTKGSTFTIRRFKENPLTPVDLIGFKSFSIEMAAYFWMAIENGASILFCGGTASGKTTALNALSLFIPSAHKIITIEDTRELNLPHKNWIAGTTRKGFSSTDNKTGKDIDMFDLIRAALRQRPRVVMVGEVRGKEAYSLFQAMATGHTSYATIHASTIHTLIQRLENPPISLPRALLTSLDIIVFQNAVNIGGKMVRRMTSVTEVIKLDPDTNQLIFMEPFSWVSKTDDRFESSGTSKILNNIRLQNDWSEEKINQELENRGLILNWMSKNNINDYREVGRIVSDYRKYPDRVLKKVMEEMKK